jgi:hypothetical protein
MPPKTKSLHVSALAGLVGLTACFLATLPSPLSAAPVSHSCRATEVATFPERIHVRCNKAAGGGIVFFAVPTANNEHAARILSTLLTGHVAGKTMVMGYDTTDTSGAAFGCAANDCRRLHYVRVQ